MISKEPYRTRPEALVRFRHEIEAMRLCNHPNIVRFRDALETPDHLYIGTCNSHSTLCLVGGGLLNVCV